MANEVAKNSQVTAVRPFLSTIIMSWLTDYSRTPVLDNNNKTNCRAFAPRLLLYKFMFEITKVLSFKIIRDDVKVQLHFSLQTAQKCYRLNVYVYGVRKFASFLFRNFTMLLQYSIAVLQWRWLNMNWHCYIITYFSSTMIFYN